MLETSMYEAVEHNDIEAVRKYYTEEPGYLDATGDGGYTILMDAAKNGRLEIVQCLVDLGATINADCEIIDHYSDQRGTAISFAFENFHHDVVKYLIQKGADTETAYYYREDEETPYSEPSVHRTCFMYAMDRSEMELLELMLQHGFNINGYNALLSDNNEETTPLFYAIAEIKPEMVKWLLDHGADPLQCIKMYEMGEINALMFAVNRGLTKEYKTDNWFKIVELLLKAGVDLAVTFDELDGQTLPDLILEDGNERYLQLFGLKSIKEKLEREEEND
ncbi:MAG: hypothetical protein HIU83_15920 [Proteobacteria bacterium]|nr:hypothetical protein [Pseudomonadota bacterium]